MKRPINYKRKRKVNTYGIGVGHTKSKHRENPKEEMLTTQTKSNMATRRLDLRFLFAKALHAQ